MVSVPLRVLTRQHLGAHKVRPQAALGQLQPPGRPGHRVVVAHHPLLGHAQDAAPRPIPVEHERRALLLRRNRKLPIVLRLVIREPRVRHLDPVDPRHSQLLRQAVLERPEQPLRASPCLRRVGRDVLDPQPLQRPPRFACASRAPVGPAGSQTASDVLPREPMPRPSHFTRRGTFRHDAARVPSSRQITSHQHTCRSGVHMPAKSVIRRRARPSCGRPRCRPRHLRERRQSSGGRRCW
jgi:hypothetical protein